jgi:hypothetical protein
MSLEQFIFSHPAQIALLGIQFQWTADTQVGGSPPGGKFGAGAGPRPAAGQPSAGVQAGVGTARPDSLAPRALQMALAGAKTDKTIMVKNMKKTEALLRCGRGRGGVGPGLGARLSGEGRAWAGGRQGKPGGSTAQPRPAGSPNPQPPLPRPRTRARPARDMVTMTVRSDLTRIQRTNLETCITVHMHQKESTEDLVRRKVRAAAGREHPGAPGGEARPLPPGLPTCR